MAVLRAKLPHLRAWTDERQRLAQRYEQALAVYDVELQQVQPWAEHVAICSCSSAPSATG